MTMEDLKADIPSNEKSCQTDELDEKAPALRLEHHSQIPAFSVEPGDPPLLQKQLQTSKSGIQQIIECFRTGTTQLKHILIKEVDTIFECKVCRSLFRGLPNLITHKEFYCFPRLSEPEPSGNCRQSLSINELLEVIYPSPKQEEHVVRLEPIPGNKNAVFQHLLNQTDVDLQSPAQSATHSMEDCTHNQQESQKNAVLEYNAEKKKANESNEIEHKDVQGDEKIQEDAGKNEVVSDDMDDISVTCCLCGKGFSSRRSVRRHCHEMHKQRLEELRKFTETRTVPISLLSVVKERQVLSPEPNEKACPACFKTFATKANVWRHFNEVHSGLITFDKDSKISGDLEDMPSDPGSPHSPNCKTVSPLDQYNLVTCKCLLCKRSYSTQARLKRHMHFVHKILAYKSSGSSSLNGIQLQSEKGLDIKHKQHLKRPCEENEDEKSPVLCKPKLSVGFDFKQLFCKLCKRQFSSRQNLAKHIELHTDNSGDIFVKFYHCPICRYESRRKRDVIRHVTVVHKKNSAYLAKILPGIENRAVKKPVETVLGNSVKCRHSKEKSDTHKEDTTLSHSLDKASAPSSVPAAICKQDVPLSSAPITRRQSLSLHTQSGTGNQKTSKCLKAQDCTEMRVTKNFLLHTCDICGCAFAKKVYLESHKRSHSNTTKINGGPVGVSTRSKSILW